MFLSLLSMIYGDYCDNKKYLIVVSSNQHIVSGCHSLTSTHTLCSTLDEALLLKVKNNTCILINEKSTLTINVTISNVYNLTIQGNFSDSKKIEVDCRLIHDKPANIGFSFINSCNVKLLNLRFCSCGVKHPSTCSKINKTIVPDLFTGFFFDKTTDVVFENVHITGSFGYGITMYNPAGVTKFITLQIDHSRQVPFTPHDYGSIYSGYESGGGLYIDYYSDDPTFSSNNQIILNGSLFLEYNKFELPQPGQMTAEKPSEYDPHIPFTRGGGVAIFFRKRSVNNTVSFINLCVSMGNKAVYGGGIYIRFRDDTKNNHVFFNQTFISDNQVVLSGGGIYIYTTNNDNSIKFFNSHFNKNRATDGGAFSEQMISQSDKMFETVLNNCEFKKNYAVLGSALHIQNINISITNITIAHNNIAIKSQDLIGQGAFYAYRSLVYFYGALNNMKNNNNSALILDFSFMTLRDRLEFMENSAPQGGAIAMYGQSQIILGSVACLVFIRNHAWHQGGAIYVLVPGLTLRPWSTNLHQIYPCFFGGFQEFNGSVSFIGNSAVSGNAIFASTLENCRNPSEKLENVITNWTNFHFFPKTDDTIVTNAVHINVNELDWHVQPGKSFSPDLTLIDERNNDVSETVTITSLDPNFKAGAKDYVVKNNKTYLNILGEPDNIVPIIIEATSAIHRFKINLSRCDFGYIYDRSSNRCECVCANDNKLCTLPVAYCTINDLYVFKDFWVFDKKPYPCPDSYCRMCPNDDLYIGYACTYSLINQCQSSRDQNSLLCSKCKTNYSVRYGGRNCWKCEGISNVLSVLLGVFLSTLFINLVVVFLNADTFSGYLVPVIYFYQVVSVLLPEKVILNNPLSAFFVDIFNLSAMYSTSEWFSFCLYDGLNDMTKLAFAFVIPTLWLFSLLVACVSSCCLCCCIFIKRWFSRESFLRGFAIVSMLVYSDYIRISLKLLKPVTIDGKRLFVFAEQEYFNGLHLVVGLVSVILVIVLNVAVLSLSSPCVTKVNCCIKIKPFYNCYKYGLDKNKQWMAGFYFVARLLLFVIDTYVIKDIRYTMLALACVCLLCFFASIKPYSEDDLWRFRCDIGILTILTVIAAYSDAMIGVNTSSEEIYTYTINILIMVPLFMLLVKLVWFTICYLRPGMEINRGIVIFNIATEASNLLTVGVIFSY